MDYIGEIVSLGIVLGAFFGVLGGVSVPTVLYWAIAEVSCYCAVRFNPYLDTRAAAIKRFGIASIGAVVSTLVLASGYGWESLLIMGVSVVIATAAANLSLRYWIARIAGSS